MSYMNIAEFPLVPIKDIDSEEMQGYAKFATEKHNEITGDKLQFKRAINGLEQGRRLGQILFTYVLEAVNSGGYVWTYQTVVFYNQRAALQLIEFGPVLPEHIKN
uniref:Cystatin domain-containing protein n=1 Tax=Cucumis melo TaxID=3656 RepID=A0A9I9CFS9_CUCME